MISLSFVSLAGIIVTALSIGIMIGQRLRATPPPAALPLAPASASVADLLRSGRKIEAIKRYREENPGVRLADAKRAVDALETPPR